MPRLRRASGRGGAISAPDIGTDRRTVLRRRVRLLVAATITYNIVEAVVALVAGTVAGSVALIGFGLDSLVEVAWAAAVAWQFAADDPQRRERTALRVIAWSFFVCWPPMSRSRRYGRWSAERKPSTPRSALYCLPSVSW